MEIVDPLAVFVKQEWWGFSIARLDPVREQPSLVSLVPQILVQIGVSNFLQGINLICGNDVTVQIHEVN